MFRRALLMISAVVVLLGCGRSKPPPPDKAPAEKPEPRLESISYLPSDKKVHGFLCTPGGEGLYPAVVLVHDRLGLTDGIKDQTYRLARDGYVVLAIDLYRGAAVKSMKDAERLERELPRQRALADIKAAVDYLIERPDVRKMQELNVGGDEEGSRPRKRQSWDLGVIGLGMGGSYALDAALADPRLREVVLCYCPLPTDAKRLKSLTASIFCVVAGKDKNVSADNIKKFCQAMETAHKNVLGIRVYGDCQPGFLDPSTWPIQGKPKDKDVEEAWKLIAEYLNKELM